MRLRLARPSAALACSYFDFVDELRAAGDTARAVSAGALVMSVPAPAERGAFLSVNTALQQMAGGVAAYVGGVLVGGNPDGSWQTSTSSPP